MKLNKNSEGYEFFGSKNAVSCNDNIFSHSVENGMKIKSLTSKHFKSTGRGIMTTKEIFPGEIIISIPTNQLITLDSLYESHLKILFLSKFDIRSKDVFILFLLTEKTQILKSSWKLYLYSIPQKYTTPSYLTEKYFDLNPLFVQELYTEQTNDIKAHVKRLKSVLDFLQKEKIKIFENVNITFKNVRWAWNVINTRSVYLNSKYLKCLKYIPYQFKIDFALAPVLDLLNHRDIASMEAYFNTANKCYEIKTFNHYAPKSQVFINYGPHCNRTLFKEYGFIIPGNVHQNITISKDKLFHVFNGNENLRVIQKFQKYFENVKCTLDGFDWNYDISAHVLLKPSCLNSYGYPKSCTSLQCCTYSTTKSLLNLLLLETEESLKKVTSAQCEVSKVVYSLLKAEMELLSKTLVELSSNCKLKDS